MFRYVAQGKIHGWFFEKFFSLFLPRLWGYVNIIFYRALYPDMKLGCNSKCWGSIMIQKSPDAIIAFGDNLWIVSDFFRAGISLYGHLKIRVFNEAKVFIGNNVALIGTSVTCRSTYINIGDGTIIAPNVIIVDSDFHNVWPPQNRKYSLGYENDKGVVIGENVWIGMNTLILKGVTIGENSVIAAGSVVVKDIPVNVLAGGNPAHVLKTLVDHK